MWTEELSRLFIGQSLDIFWTQQVSAPSVEEYLQMVDGSKHFPYCILTRGVHYLTMKMELTGFVYHQRQAGYFGWHRNS